MGVQVCLILLGSPSITLQLPVLGLSLAAATIASPSTLGVVRIRMGLPIIGLLVWHHSAVRPFC